MTVSYNTVSRIAIASCLLTLLAAAAQACDVPVFRYALEQWTPDDYGAVIFHRGPLSAADKALVDKLKRADKEGQPVANIEAVLVDLAKPLPKGADALWKAQKPNGMPWVTLQYPRMSGLDRPAWSGRLRPSTVMTLTNSPKRKELVRRLLQGETAVFVQVDSGDAEKDEAAAKMLRDQIAKLPTEVEFTGGQEELTEDATPEGARKLKLSYSVLRIGAKELSEQLFRAILLNCDPQLTAVPGPKVFPVFGQGRALCVISGQDLISENIQAVAEFLVGDCSCEVKAQNPGFDLLMAADWYSLPEEQRVSDPSLPSLSDLPAAITLDDTGNTPKAEAPAGGQKNEPKPPAPTPNTGKPGEPEQSPSTTPPVASLDVNSIKARVAELRAEREAKAKEGHAVAAAEGGNEPGAQERVTPAAPSGSSGPLMRNVAVGLAVGAGLSAALTAYIRRHSHRARAAS